MRAVGITRFGGPEVLEVVEIDEPTPQEGEVSIAVKAATVNATDTVVRVGIRAPLYEGVDPPYVVGMEAAGTIDAVGPGSSLTAGEDVIALVVPGPSVIGAQAEKIVVPEGNVAPMPKGASFAEAATLPMNGLTVRLALDLLGLQPGQVLLVTGAAGAVGGYAIELAKSEGLTVVADASEADRALVAGLGADLVVARGDDAASAVREAFKDGVDAVIDAALMGEKILPAVRQSGALAALRPFGGETERDITIHPIWVGDYAGRSDKLAELSRLAGEHKLTLRVAQTLPPEEAPEAHRMLEAGGVRGRIVFTF